MAKRHRKCVFVIEKSSNDGGCVLCVRNNTDVDSFRSHYSGDKRQSTFQQIHHNAILHSETQFIHTRTIERRTNCGKFKYAYRLSAEYCRNSQCPMNSSLHSCSFAVAAVAVQPLTWTHCLCCCWCCYWQLHLHSVPSSHFGRSDSAAAAHCSSFARSPLCAALVAQTQTNVRHYSHLNKERILFNLLCGAQSSSDLSIWT